MNVNYYEYPPPKCTDELSIESAIRALNEPADKGRQFAIFISVPFCRSKCNSCPFFKSLLPRDAAQADRLLDSYVRRLRQDINHLLSFPYIYSRKVSSIYFGGGTASLLSPKHLDEIMTALRSFNVINSETEITLEGNPVELSKLEYVKALENIGITRVSVGFQSQTEVVVDSIGSPHTMQQSLDALQNLANSGLPYNVDMLYGVPNQTFESWKQDVIAVCGLRPHSITINRYILFKNIQGIGYQKESHYCLDDERSGEWYKYAKTVYVQAGYQEYRNGSFSLPGHNQKYSQLVYGGGGELLGVGVGAYSWLANRTIKNTASVKKYMAKEELVDRISAVSVPLADDECIIKDMIQSLHAQRLISTLSIAKSESDLIQEFFKRLHEEVVRGCVTECDFTYSLSHEGLKHRQDVLWRITPYRFKSLISYTENYV